MGANSNIASSELLSSFVCVLLNAVPVDPLSMGDSDVYDGPQTKRPRHDGWGLKEVAKPSGFRATGTRLLEDQNNAVKRKKPR